MGGCRFPPCHGRRRPATHDFLGTSTASRGRGCQNHDNEAGKGDRKHIGKVEGRYVFVSPRPLVSDSWEMEASMNAVTIGISSVEETKQRMHHSVLGR